MTKSLVGLRERNRQVKGNSGYLVAKRISSSSNMLCEVPTEPLAELEERGQG